MEHASRLAVTCNLKRNLHCG